MAAGTIELAPPNEGGDDRQPEVLARRIDEMVADVSLSDKDIEDFMERMVPSEPAPTVTKVDPTTKEAPSTTMRGARTLYAEGSESYGYQGSPVLGRVLLGGMRNRVAGVEGRAFRPPWANKYVGQQALRGYVSRVATL